MYHRGLPTAVTPMDMPTETEKEITFQSCLNMDECTFCPETHDGASRSGLCNAALHGELPRPYPTAKDGRKYGSISILFGKGLSWRPRMRPYTA